MIVLLLQFFEMLSLLEFLLIGVISGCILQAGLLSFYELGFEL